MAEPTVIALIQVIFLLTFPFGFFILFTSVWKFYHYLDHHAPSQRHLHLKLQMICQIPSRNTKRSGKKKRFCEKMRRKKRKMPILTYQLAWAAFWVACRVKLALQITYLQLWRAACILSTRVYSMRERVKWKVRRTTSKIVALESIIEEDSPTYCTV